MNRFPIAVALVAASLAGCGTPAGSNNDGGTSSGRKVEPWENVASRLRKENDLAACKSALGQLNNELAERTDLPPVPALTPEAEKALAAMVPLTGDDLAEIRGATYTALDPAYVAQCYYMRDAARSLDPSGIPTRDLARLGFAWTCRQVMHLPWMIEGLGYEPAVPPDFALNRGSGAGLDRMFVFLALLQQFGLDGCLIGSEAEVAPRFLTLGKSKVPKGPFWAVGVRLEKDVVLFDPWRGVELPGTLSQIRANPDLLKPWRDDTAQPWDVSPNEVKSAQAYLTAQMSAFAPRMAVLEQKVQNEAAVRLAVDPAAVLARFQASGVAAKWYNPPADPYSYTRVLAKFLPVEEGGQDRDTTLRRAHTHYVRSLLPGTFEEIPKSLNAAGAERLRVQMISVYGASFYLPPSPRERIARGQLQDASRDLMQKMLAFGRGIERLRNVEPGEAEKWSEAANAAFDLVNAARYPNPGQTAPQPDNDPAVVDARSKLEEFWKLSNGVWQLYVDRATAFLGRSEAAYLLALAKHEEAERRQSRGAAGAVDAWREATNSWNSFLEQDGDLRNPARSAHAKSLAARAKQLAEPAKP